MRAVEVRRPRLAPEVRRPGVPTDQPAAAVPGTLRKGPSPRPGPGQRTVGGRSLGRRATRNRSQGDRPGRRGVGMPAPSVRRSQIRHCLRRLAILRVKTPALLVDDVVTKGRTLLAAAARLHEAFPNADLRAFALVRTMGFLPQLERLLEPCEGIIRWAGGDARREP